MLVTMEREHLPMAKWAFSLMEIPSNGEILDIGCGGGYNVARLLQKSTGAKVYGSGKGKYFFSPGKIA